MYASYRSRDQSDSVCECMRSIHEITPSNPVVYWRSRP